MAQRRTQIFLVCLKKKLLVKAGSLPVFLLSRLSHPS
jgi:hypothetical protein